MVNIPAEVQLLTLFLSWTVLFDEPVHASFPQTAACILALEARCSENKCYLQLRLNTSKCQMRTERNILNTSVWSRNLISHYAD